MEMVPLILDLTYIISIVTNSYLEQTAILTLSLSLNPVTSYSNRGHVKWDTLSQYYSKNVVCLCRVDYIHGPLMLRILYLGVLHEKAIPGVHPPRHRHSMWCCMARA